MAFTYKNQQNIGRKPHLNEDGTMNIVRIKGENNVTVYSCVYISTVL